MKRCKYKSVIYTIELIFYYIFVFFALLFYVLAIVLEDKLFIKEMFIGLLVIILVRILLTLKIVLIDKTSKKNSVIFNKDYIVYKNQKYTVNNLTMGYFRFRISFLQGVLEFPTLRICSKDFKLNCYLMDKDIKNLKQMGYKIKEIK